METKLTTLCSALVLVDVRRTDHFIVAVDRQLSFAEQRLRQSQLSLGPHSPKADPQP